MVAILAVLITTPSGALCRSIAGFQTGSAYTAHLPIHTLQYPAAALATGRHLT